MKPAYLVTCLAAVLLIGGAAAAADDARGFLYGRLETDSGDVYTGFLRWADQETCWDDLFQSAKNELPHLKDPAIPAAPEKREKRIRFMGMKFTVGGRHDDEPSRVMCARFGDLAAIEPRGNSHARIHLRNGAVLEVSGYSDDVSSEIFVRDPRAGEVKVDWDRIKAITFLPVPAGADRGARRLHGEVETDEGTFTGFVAWDKSECLSSDLLDGDTTDGRVEVPLGDVRSIERLGRHGCRVELRDGSQLRLEGTNDVNEGNRGLLVEDPRYGKVEVNWSVFDKATFSDPPGSGRGYAEYPPLGALRGTVATADGVRHTGLLVLDLDQAEGWEMVDAAVGGVVYEIPLCRVAAITPLPAGSCRLTLIGGQTLEFTGERNAGVLVLGATGTGSRYVPWQDVTEIQLTAGR